MFQNSQTPEILLVDDGPGDVRFTQMALRQSTRSNHLNVVTDGEEAMAFVTRTGVYQRAPRPDLILLDWNLPKLEGWEVLKNIKEDPDLRAIPVVVLSNCRDDREIVKAYNLRANCFVCKPRELTDFLEVVHRCEHFWLHIVERPRAA